MDRPDPDILPPRTGDEPSPPPGAEDESPLPGFPVYLLAAPGFICTLFAAMCDATVQSTRSEGASMLIGGLATIGAIACFGVIGAKSEERHVQVGVAVAIGATIFAYCAAVLRLN